LFGEIFFAERAACQGLLLLYHCCHFYAGHIFSTHAMLPRREHVCVILLGLVRLDSYFSVRGAYWSTEYETISHRSFDGGGGHRRRGGACLRSSRAIWVHAAAGNRAAAPVARVERSVSADVDAITV
jgi:hypothetical protein